MLCKQTDASVHMNEAQSTCGFPEKEIGLNVRQLIFFGYKRDTLHTAGLRASTIHDSCETNKEILNVDNFEHHTIF